MQATDILLIYSDNNKRISLVDSQTSYHLWYNSSIVNRIQVSSLLHQDLTQISIFASLLKLWIHIQGPCIARKFTIFEAFCNNWFVCWCLELFIDVLNYSLMFCFNLNNPIKKHLVIWFDARFNIVVVVANKD